MVDMTMSRRGMLVGGAALSLPVLGQGSAQARPRPGRWALERAHAHNDYEHPRPLLDALSHGFTSVEADVWLVDGELYIGHDGPDFARTLRSLYLDPLRRWVWRGGHAIHRGFPRASLRLLIDVKSGGEATYDVLQQQLSGYPDLVTVWRGGRRKTKPVTAVLSGQLANRVAPQRDTRWFGFDGRIGTLPAGATGEQLPLVSENWTKLFTWRGAGAFPQAERARLHSIVRELHGNGHQVRFWATPDLPGAPRLAVWRELVSADVDVLNTDDLPALAAFLRAEDPQER